MMKYEPVIGLEIHVELNTKSKMFCRCSADYFGKQPNTHTCPVCLGLPGALPFINEEAINDCIKIGLALNCTISEKSLFERKNYFYPDLSKGYQISQYRWPLCVNGQITLDDGSVIRINRAHQEEDTGKLSHTGGVTLVDFNRSGVPLVEIVTEPDFTNTQQIRDYAKKLQQIVRDLGVSSADMERGDMRLEANISVRPEDQKELPTYRVELKNINSFRFMVAAVEYEIKRQTKELEEGRTLNQETRGWDEDKKQTYSQRSKEEAHDYRYFPEPDLPELRIDEMRRENLKKEIRGKLSSEKISNWVTKYGITPSSGATLVTQGMSELFDRAASLGQEHGISPVGTANYIINTKPDTNTTPAEVIKNLVEARTGIIESGDELEALAKEAINDNPDVAQSYKKGKLNAIQVLVGAVMRKSSGKADAAKVKEVLEKLLFRFR